MEAKVEPIAADADHGTLRNGPFLWYRTSSPAEKRAFWGCKIGYVVDAMDTQFLSLVIPALIATWGITRGDAGLIGTVTLLSSAVGGWGAGLLSDRIGRVKTLQITILWFAIFTLLCGVTRNFTELLWARGLMGLGFGGEWTAGAVLIGEVIRPRDRGKAVGLVQAGWAIGWGIATLLYVAVFSLVPQQYAWRVLFAIGVTPAPFIFWIRRFVDEPEVHKQAGITTASARLFDIFRADIVWTTLRASALAIGIQGGYYATTTWLPTYLKTERHLSIIGTGGYLAVIIVGSYIGYLTGAYVSDKFGRRRTLIVFASASLATVLIYTQIAFDNRSMLALGFPLGFFASGIFSGVGPLLTELFPTRIRGSGQGFCYNFGRATGAVFPFLIGRVSQTTSLGHAIGVFAAVAYGLVILAALTLPETRGRALQA
jgi:MFS family permease